MALATSKGPSSGGPVSPDSPNRNYTPRLSFGGVPILYRYVLREVSGPFFISLFVFTSILFLARLLKLVDLVVNKNVPLTDTLLLFSYVIPGFLELALPMALLVGVLLAFGRLSQDSELIVIRATGMSLGQLAVPVFFFASFAGLASLVMAFWVRPWANYQLDVGLFEIVKVRASAGLTAGAFTELGPLTIYSEELDDATGKMNNVLISDRRDPEQSRNFIAKHGQMISDQEHRALSVQLYDGVIEEGTGLNFTVTSFAINSIKLQESELFEEGNARTGKRSNEMSITELLATMRSENLSGPGATKEELLQHARYQVELQRRLAIPVSCLCVALAALALGVQPVRANRSWGAAGNVMLGISLILLYYLLLALASALGSQRMVPVTPVMWVPNILFALLGIFWFKQVGSERWTAVSQAFTDSFARLAARLSAKGSATGAS